jgi:hypothetical protein
MLRKDGEKINLSEFIVIQVLARRPVLWKLKNRKCNSLEEHDVSRQLSGYV